MNVRDIQKAIEDEKVVFGIRQTLKFFSKKPKSKAKVFVVRDARDETKQKLEDAKINFEELKSKMEVAKELGLDFESEVFLVK